MTNIFLVTDTMNWKSTEDKNSFVTFGGFLVCPEYCHTIVTTEVLKRGNETWAAVLQKKFNHKKYLRLGKTQRKITVAKAIGRGD